MPANKKHLLKTRLGRASKILAVLLGSLFASIALHLVLAVWLGKAYVVPASTFSFLIIWVAFMVWVYWIKKPWKSWLMLLLVILISGIGIYLGKL